MQSQCVSDCGCCFFGADKNVPNQHILVMYKKQPWFRY